MASGGVGSAEAGPVESKLRAVLNSELLIRTPLDGPLGAFRERFGPAALRGLDGEALLRRMHGRQGADDKQSLAYWLEFKNDDEFPGPVFGSIAGGNASKFGVYQRQADGAWVRWWPGDGKVIDVEGAIDVARRQRDALLAGDALLAAMDPADASDEAYARLQAAMVQAAPLLADNGWSHKWWSLIHPDRLDMYHAARMQRFHLIKLLQAPPDGLGTMLPTAPARFNCAGRFVGLARQLGVPVPTLTAALNRLHGAFHRYWRVGTDASDSGESQWPVMLEGGWVSMGWRDQVPDMTEAARLSAKDAKAWVKGKLDESGLYADPGTATRKAGELVNLVREMQEGDLVIACSGRKVLGVGQISGSYRHDPMLAFSHTRPVQWLSAEPWTLPENEGYLTSCVEIGRHATTLLAVEQRLESEPPIDTPRPPRPGITMPPLERPISTIAEVLERKSQVLLYGPPGTGKTYWAQRAARELAARHAFRSTYDDLRASDKAQLEGPHGLVRLCTFHSGYGYEDFLEGLRPALGQGGQLVFTPRDGLFKRLCQDASARPDREFFLLIDEFNRGDVPRIFGELLTVLERDKRGQKVLLPVTGEEFAVPSNVRVVGTMNTADRSISLLDAALRRRFGFIEFMPDSTALHGRRAGDLPLGPWLDALNARLRTHLRTRDARNLQIGHAYLWTVGSITELSRALRHELVPLLEEYCYDDAQTLQLILGSALVDEAGRIRERLFEMPDTGELEAALRFPEMAALVQAAPADDAAQNGKDDDDDANP